MSGNIAETQPGYPVGMSEGSVTVSITRKVDPAKRSQANAWARAGQELCSAKPGYLGSGWIQVGEHSDEWHMLFRFRDSETLHAWEVSPEREWWLSTAQGLVEHSRVERRTGIEGWFDEPKEVRLEQPGIVPPRWSRRSAFTSPFCRSTFLRTSRSACCSRRGIGRSSCASSSSQRCSRRS